MPLFYDYCLYPYPLLFTYRTGYDVYNIASLHRGKCRDPLILKKSELDPSFN